MYDYYEDFNYYEDFRKRWRILRELRAENLISDSAYTALRARITEEYYLAEEVMRDINALPTTTFEHYAH